LSRWPAKSDDEETTPEERAAQRADRFSTYQGKRAADAEQARKSVSAIADGIPLGQPILVGHHSERHARRDAEKIENGLRRAVRLWETVGYWQQRAAGAIAHARIPDRLPQANGPAQAVLDLLGVAPGMALGVVANKDGLAEGDAVGDRRD